MVWQRADSEGLEWFCAATTLSVWSVLYAISAEWSQPIFYTSCFHDSSAMLYLQTIDSTQVKLHKSIMRRYSLKTRVMKTVIIPLYYHRSTHIHMLRRHALVTKTYPECSSDQQGLDSTHSQCTQLSFFPLEPDVGYSWKMSQNHLLYQCSLSQIHFEG